MALVWVCPVGHGLVRGLTCLERKCGSIPDRESGELKLKLSLQKPTTAFLFDFCSPTCQHCASNTPWGVLLWLWDTRVHDVIWSHSITDRRREHHHHDCSVLCRAERHGRLRGWPDWHGRHGQDVCPTAERCRLEVTRSLSFFSLFSELEAAENRCNFGKLTPISPTSHPPSLQ